MKRSELIKTHGSPELKDKYILELEETLAKLQELLVKLSE